MSESISLKLKLQANDAVDRAESDPKQALEVLRIASIFLSHDEPLPKKVSSYLASAFFVASCKSDVKDASHALLVELGLKALNARPSVITPSELHSELSNKLNGRNISQRVTNTAKKFGVAESYIWKLKKRYQDEFDEIDRSLDEFRSLVSRDFKALNVLLDNSDLSNSLKALKEAQAKLAKFRKR